MAPQNSISDDWEDVGDDNLSVISLSGSEIELPSVQGTPKNRNSPATAAPSSTKTSSSGASPQSQPAKRELETTSTHEDVSAKGKEADRSGKEELPSNPESPIPGVWHDAPSAPSETLEDPFKDPETDAAVDEADDKESDVVKEIIVENSHDIDPAFLSETMTSLQYILRDTMKTISKIDALGSELTRPSITACQDIGSQVQRLQPMIVAYIKASDYSNLPIDPALHDWLTGVRVKVIALRAESQRLAREQMQYQRNHGEYKTLWQYADNHVEVTELVKIWDELDKYKKQMEDFLPIMLADFDEYQTKNLHIVTPFEPTKPINIPIHSYAYRPGRRYGLCEDSAPKAAKPNSDGNPMIWDLPPVPQPLKTSAIPVPGTNPDGPSNSTWLLRRDLYHLKDLLLRAQERLTASVSKLDGPLAEWAIAAAIRYTKLSQVVGNAVSNHASDWIESTSNGDMTYPEFLALDRDLISIYSAQLEEVVGKPDERDTYTPRYTSRFGRRGHQGYQQLFNADELNPDELEVLERIGDLLAGMFKMAED